MDMLEFFQNLFVTVAIFKITKIQTGQNPYSFTPQNVL